MNKEKFVGFRLEQNDFCRLEERAKNAGLKDVSKYLRFLVIKDAGDMTISPEAEEQLKTYFADTTRLGSNINQLVREINSDIKTVDQHAGDLEYLLHQAQPILIDIKELLKQLIRQTRL